MDRHAIEKAGQVVKKYKTRDPDELIDLRNILLIQTDRFKDLLGYYVIYLRKDIIGINTRANPVLQRSAKGHELGHYFLERSEARSGANFRDTFFYSVSTAKSEMSANTFAAELLLSDEMVLEPMHYHVFEEMQNKWKEHLPARCSAEYRMLAYNELLQEFYLHTEPTTVDSIARACDVDANLVDFKLRILAEKGYDLPKLPEVRSDFFRDSLKQGR
ncbi:MAG: ImmA/IrrE family metallo-endopeptidase [Lachnospiraceae bacterium]|nr:ImmA/IrrE family metallo-endopeptidase [Lachnospiraceae bacterium]